MSMVPLNNSQLTPRDLAMQMAMSNMSRNPEDESLGMAVAANLAVSTVTTVSNASNQASATMVDVLERLAALGYDKDSDVAKARVHANAEIDKVLLHIGNSVGRLIK
jgi:hypothetical protein